MNRTTRHALFVLFGTLLLAPLVELRAAQQLTYDGSALRSVQGELAGSKLSPGALSTHAGRRWLSHRTSSEAPMA